MFARSATRTSPSRRLRRFGRVGAPARGFILGYILFALIVLGIVVAVLSRLNEAEADAKWVDAGLVRVKENLQNVRVQVLTCSALLAAADGSPTISFPPQADLDTPTPLNELECPQGTQPPIKLFDGSAGVFLPTPPQGFAAYTYVNTFETAALTDAAEVYVETSTSSPSGAAVLNRLLLGATGPETEVTTTGGVTRLRFYLAKREATSP